VLQCPASCAGPVTSAALHAIPALLVAARALALWSSAVLVLWQPASSCARPLQPAPALDLAVLCRPGSRGRSGANTSRALDHSHLCARRSELHALCHFSASVSSALGRSAQLLCPAHGRSGTRRSRALHHSQFSARPFMRLCSAFLAPRPFMRSAALLGRFDARLPPLLLGWRSLRSLLALAH